MIPVQVIKVVTSKGNFIIEIEKNKGYRFSISPIDYPDDWVLENNKVFNSAEECFKNVITGIQSYCKSNKVDIYSIDNPNNCELISADNEKDITKNIGMSIPVKVNGNLR